MFKEIIFHHNRLHYQLIDDDFIGDVYHKSGHTSQMGWASGSAVILINEYSKRKLPVLKNLFLMNCFLANNKGLSFERILYLQNYWIDKYPFYKETINFSENYHKQLLDMWNKNKAFL